MNRTALCIKMLLLLYTRGKMSTQEIAMELETNPRNVREYKKELITAGYNIIESRGRYGGYSLDENCFFPTLKLDDSEIKALNEARNFINGHTDFLLQKDLNNALDKVLGSQKDISINLKSYLNLYTLPISPSEVEMYRSAIYAIEESKEIEIKYKGIHDTQPKLICVDPYQIIHYDFANYLVGYSHAAKDYRLYRFSEQRLFSLTIKENKFLKDSNYNLDLIVGEHSLFKNPLETVTIKVSNDSVRFFKEIYWGMDLKCEKELEDYSVFSFKTDNFLKLYTKLFSYGNFIELLEPKKRREEFVNMMNAVKNKYM